MRWSTTKTSHELTGIGSRPDQVAKPAEILSRGQRKAISCGMGRAMIDSKIGGIATMAPGRTGEKLSRMIKAAIRDHVVTNDEYDQIMAEADSDGVIDSQERALLRQLNDMIDNNTIKRVTG